MTLLEDLESAQQLVTQPCPPQPGKQFIPTLLCFIILPLFSGSRPAQTVSEDILGHTIFIGACLLGPVQCVCRCSLPDSVETEDLKPHIDFFSSLYMTGCVRGRSPQQVEGPEGGEQVRGGGDGDSAQISTGENAANPK